MRRVLVIAGLFPPSGGSGVQRTLKFCKHLPHFGWQPIVLTVNMGPQEEYDPTLLQELPGSVEVHRTWFPDLYAFLRRSKSGLGGLQNPPGIDRLSNAPNDRSWYATIRSIIENWVFVPDSHIGWFPSALLAGLRLATSRNADVIYSTSDPFTDHLIALAVKKLLRKPWVTDFRDLWTQETHYQRSSRLRQKLDDRLECTFLASADRVTVASYRMIDFFLSKHPAVGRGKFVEITNGFDREDFYGLEAAHNPHQFVMTFTGRFGLDKSFSLPFLTALGELVAEKSELGASLKFVIAGSLSDRERQAIAALSLEPIVEIVGYVPHKASLALLLKSDALLLVNNPGPAREVYYTGKLFEYLASGKPILALAEPGVATDLVERAGAGIVVSPHDVASIKKALLELYQRRGERREPWPGLQRFERRSLARSLATVLDEAVAGHAQRESVRADKDAARKTAGQI